MRPCLFCRHSVSLTPCSPALDLSSAAMSPLPVTRMPTPTRKCFFHPRPTFYCSRVASTNRHPASRKPPASSRVVVPVVVVSSVVEVVESSLSLSSRARARAPSPSPRWTAHPFRFASPEFRPNTRAQQSSLAMQLRLRRVPLATRRRGCILRHVRHPCLAQSGQVNHANIVLLHHL